MKLFIVVFLLVSSVLAKMPTDSENYVCPKSAGQIEAKPVLLHQTSEGIVIGICGEKQNGLNNFSNMNIYAFPDAKKPFFTNKSKNKNFLAIEKHDGLLLIEKVKIDTEYVELFRHEWSCDKNKCHDEKERCIAVNKIKQKWIFQKTKDAKVKSRMKKLGCA